MSENTHASLELSTRTVQLLPRFIPLTTTPPPASVDADRLLALHRNWAFALSKLSEHCAQVAAGSNCPRCHVSEDAILSVDGRPVFRLGDGPIGPEVEP